MHGPSEVVDPDAFSWTDRGWRAPPFERWVIYELHVGNATLQGTFAALIPRLRELRGLGVTTLELMPVASSAWWTVPTGPARSCCAADARATSPAIRTAEVARRARAALAWAMPIRTFRGASVLCTLAALAHAAPARAQAERAAPVASPAARVILFGTGTPILSPAHSGNSVGVLVRGSLYVFDAGPGVVNRMKEAVAKGVLWDTIPAIFVTHLHSDHTLGLPELLYYHGAARGAFGSGGPLTIFGPPGTRDMMEHIRAAWALDREVRSRDGERARSRAGIDSRTVRATEIARSGVVYRDANIVVTAFEVPHTIWPHAFAYRIDAPGRSIVISGDERPSEAIVRACNGCDILLHEVYSAEGLKMLPPAFSAYHTRAHTSTYELADIATKARPRLLVLYHQLYFGGRTDADLLREIATRYRGSVVSGRDLDVF